MSPTRPSSPAGDAPAPAGKVVAFSPYAIGTAARLAGIPPETLRIWERRYQLLAPGRTGGGHRLYSEDDVQLLRAVKRLVDAGMRIGAVAALGHDRIHAEAVRLGPVETTVQEQASPLIEEIIEAARALDERRVAQLLDRPLLLASGEEVVQTLYLRLLQRVGDLWHRGQLSIAVEHFVEKMVTARVLAVLQSTPQPASGHLALCACPADERHEVGLFAAALSLKAGGFPVTILGGDVPAEELRAAVETSAPSIVVLAITNQMAAATASRLREVLESDPIRRVPLILGGSAARGFALTLQRQATIVDRIEEIVDTARALVHPPRR
jgi:DNA-binding transcriptional MerR regulator/methylmalonyl-CoA mutase cobalamin-binding subunit